MEYEKQEFFFYCNTCVLQVYQYTFCADWVNKGLLFMFGACALTGEGGGDEGHRGDAPNGDPGGEGPGHTDRVPRQGPQGRPVHILQTRKYTSKEPEKSSELSYV